MGLADFTQLPPLWRLARLLDWLGHQRSIRFGLDGSGVWLEMKASRLLGRLGGATDGAICCSF